MANFSYGVRKVPEAVADKDQVGRWAKMFFCKRKFSIFSQKTDVFLQNWAVSQSGFHSLRVALFS